MWFTPRIFDVVYSPHFWRGLPPGFLTWFTPRIFNVGLLPEDFLYTEDVEENAKWHMYQYRYRIDSAVSEDAGIEPMQAWKLAW